MTEVARCDYPLQGTAHGVRDEEFLEVEGQRGCHGLGRTKLPHMMLPPVLGGHGGLILSSLMLALAAAGCSRPNPVPPVALETGAAAPTITFFAHSGGNRNPAFLSDAPCPLGAHIGRLVYIETENGNESAQLGCWRRAGDTVYLDFFSAKASGKPGSYTLAHESLSNVTEDFTLLPGKAWPVTTEHASPHPVQPAVLGSGESIGSKAPAWYAANAAFTECFASPGPAVRMAELIDEGARPETKVIGNPQAPNAVEVGFYRGETFSFRTYYRSVEQCRLEQTVEGKKAVIPESYK